jgi:membrane protein implicated in regulation of membrane protease activity
LVAQRVWRVALIAAGVLIGTNLLTAGGMYLWLQATVASLDVRLAAAGAERWRSLIAANPGDLINQER